MTKANREYWIVALLITCISLGPLFCRNSLAQEKLSLSVVTYNIRFGDYGMENLAQTLGALKPDLLFLQEVHGPPFLAGRTDQSQFLAKALGLHASFGRARFWLSGEYGLAILSRFPILESQVYQLPNMAGEEQEILFHVRVETPPGPLNLYTVHLTAKTHIRGHDADLIRQRQAKAVRKVLADQQEAFIFAGDLNSLSHANITQEFRKHWQDLFKIAGRGRGATFPASFPIVRLDYIFYQGPFHPQEARVIPSRASDHRPLWGKMEFIPR